MKKKIPDWMRRAGLEWMHRGFSQMGGAVMGKVFFWSGLVLVALGFLSVHGVSGGRPIQYMHNIATNPLVDYEIKFSPEERTNFAYCVAIWPCRDLSAYGHEVRPGVYKVNLQEVLGHNTTE